LKLGLFGVVKGRVGVIGLISQFNPLGIITLSARIDKAIPSFLIYSGNLYGPITNTYLPDNV
jgi:hypothetical protein